MNMIRKNIMMERNLWSEIEKRSLEESAARGRRVSISEWIRTAARMRMAGDPAVPELLEAAKAALLSVGTVMDGSQTHELAEILRAAIAKAEGV